MFTALNPALNIFFGGSATCSTTGGGLFFDAGRFFCNRWELKGTRFGAVDVSASPSLTLEAPAVVVGLLYLLMVVGAGA